MPKATLSFTLPEEEQEHLQAVHGGAAFLALNQIRLAIRSRNKHEVPDDKTLDSIAQTLIDLQHETGIEI